MASAIRTTWISQAPVHERSAERERESAESVPAFIGNQTALAGSRTRQARDWNGGMAHLSSLPTLH
jgi:hypothetical protein